MKSWLLAIVIGVFCWVSMPLIADHPSGVTVTPELSALPKANGDKLEVKIRFDISGHKHIYSALKKSEMGVPTKFNWGGEGYELLDGISEPAPQKYIMKIGDDNYTNWQYEKKVTFTQKIRITDIKKFKVLLGIHASVCDEDGCLEFSESFSASSTAQRFVPFSGDIGVLVKMAEAEKVEVSHPSGAMATIELGHLPKANGDELDVAIRFDISGHKHIYSSLKKSEMGIPTKFSWGGEGYELLGGISEPAPQKYIMKIGDEHHTNWQYEKKVTFTQKIRVTDVEEFKVFLGIHASVCDEDGCLEFNESFSASSAAKKFVSFTGDIGFPVNVVEVAEVKKGDIAKKNSSSTQVKEQPVEEKKQEAGSILGSIWSGIIAGLIALITPCVFPMVPITVSYFMKQGGDDRSSQIRLALVYCFGLVFFFVGLGLLLVVLMKMNVEGADVNEFANNPYINSVIGVIFLLFAFSFMGAFELRPPNWIMNKASSSSRGGGYIGVLVMGFTFAITSFTCTAPIVGSALGLAVQGNDFMTPFFVMLGFSGVIAFLFFFLALFPRMLKSMPKSGGWLGTVKVVLGFLELGLAFKFFRSADINWNIGILSHDMILILWTVIMLFTALYLFGVFRFEHDSPVEGMTVTRVMVAMSFTFFTMYFAFGLLGAKLNSDIEGFILSDPPGYNAGFISPFNNGKFMSGGGAKDKKDDGKFHPDFENDYEGALKKARETNKPIFIDFTGKT